jgi:hypothetical protein
LLEFDVHEAEYFWFLKLTIWKWGPQRQPSSVLRVGVKARNVGPKTPKQENDCSGDVKSCWKGDGRVITRIVDGLAVFTLFR